MKKLVCPSCGGKLELPENLEVAHCMYCGTKLLLQESDASRDSQKLHKYNKLCEAAIEVDNYEEAYSYSSKILEIDTNNVDAWINKGVATCYLSTAGNNRYEEGMEYLNIAKRIAPSDSRIEKLREKITRKQKDWCMHLGTEELELGGEIYESYGSDFVFGDLDEAKRRSEEHIIRAVDYFMQAHKCDPDDYSIIRGIEKAVRLSDWISWSKEIQDVARMAR